MRQVGSWIDKDGNHIEMGLHVFFGCCPCSRSFLKT